MKEEREHLLERFWMTYNGYMSSMENFFRPALSNLLEQIENDNRAKQLLHPNKHWNKIIGWQVLHNKVIVLHSKELFKLHEGEIILWNEEWQHDILISRKNSNKKLNHMASKWDKIPSKPFNEEEKGLYLPIFQISDIVELTVKNRLEEFNEY